MSTKIKLRSPGDSASPRTVKPLRLHDVTNLESSANAAVRRRLSVVPPASGPANHARHHVSRSAQA